MGYYFDDRNSAAWSYGDDAGRIIDLLGTRFMGENPVTPFIWRTFDESGIQADRKARYLLDFARRFPGGENGEIVYAAADLYCPLEYTVGSPSVRNTTFFPASSSSSIFSAPRR